MQNKALKFKSILLVISFLVLPGFSKAAPLISAPTPSSVISGQVVTVAGSGFGSKAVIAPIKFDDFQAGNNGDSVATHGWEIIGVPPIISTEFPRYGAKSAMHDFTDTAQWDSGYYLGGMFDSASRLGLDQIYFSYYVYTKPLRTTSVLYNPASNYSVGDLVLWNNTGGDSKTMVWECQTAHTSSTPFDPALEYYNNYTYWKPVYSRNVKYGRATSGTGSDETRGNPQFNLLTQSENGGPSWSQGLNNGSDTNVFYSGDFFDPQGKLWPLTWHRIEVYVKLSSSAGATDGVRQYFSDGKEIKREENVATLTGIDNDPHFNTVFSPYYVSHEHGLPGDLWPVMPVQYKIFTSDFYVDKTRARVEIGNASTFANCTHREIQIPQTTWNDGQLEIKVNQGSFADGATAYLYVVDEDGSVNAVGYPITFDGILDTTAPSAPSGLSVL
ncbi:MAG: hypothetical protein HGA36_02840 [Candidatus Moranbacteria bacterium]|nr:hypothetical protein [Candidatus Moranbacteria bacterium]